jgi:predicted Zn-dependent protease
MTSVFLFGLFLPAWRMFRRPLALLALLPLLTAAPVSAQTDTNAASATIQSALLSAARNALKLGDAAGAIFYYNRYLQQQPDDRLVNLELAGVLTQADRSEEALAACDQVLRTDPANPEAQKLKAIALGRLGRTREALRLIADLRARFPADLELQKTEAGFRALQGDRQFSRDLYRDLLLAGFNNAKDWQDYLELLAADQQWDLLLETYDAYRARLAVNDAVRFAVLRAHLARHHWAGVETFFAELTAADLRRDAAILVADQLAAAGRLDDAVRFLEPVLDRDDPDPNLTAKLVLLEAYNKRPVRALRRLDALPRGLQTDRVNIARAKIFWAAGRPGDALAELDRLGLPDTQVEAALARAGLLYDLHREWEIPTLLARIAADLERAGGPDRKLAWCLTALAHIRAGNADAARPLLAEFKRLEPADLAPDILLVLAEQAARRPAAYDAAVAQLGMRLRDYQPGAELIRPALLDDVPSAAWGLAWNTRPTNPVLLLKQADAALREGRIAEAERVYEHAATRPETAVDGRLGLAACALRRRDTDAVRRQAEALRETAMEFPQLIAAARLMLQAGLDGLAESFHSRIVPAQADHPDALVVRAAWLIRAGRPREAVETLAKTQPAGPAETGILTYQFQRLADLARSSDDPLYILARERLLALARGERAAGGLDAALAAADVMIRRDDHAQARELLERAGPAPQRDLRACERLLVADIRMGRYDDAERQIRAILARRPGDVGRRVLLARMAVWQSDYPLAWRRYDELAADYPEDRLIPLEREAKQNRALERHRRSAPPYAAYTELEPNDREMAAENGDAWLLRDFSRAAADRYRPASWAFPDDADLRQALAAAERRSHGGLYGAADYLQRTGRDRKVDVDQSGFEGGVRVPRGPDAFTLEAGAGLTRFRFDDANAETLNARRLAARGRQLLTNGVEAAAAFEMLDFQTLDTAWRANLDLGYQGLDGWKVAVIGGRQDLRENYYTMRDGMENYWLGLYAQWQPTERLRLFGQYRVIEIPAPSAGAIVPTNYCTGLATQTVGKTEVVTPAPIPSTWEKNHAYEGVAEASYQILFAPRSLRLWANVYRYETEKQNDLYWTPEDAFVSGQVGLHWRHSLGARQFPGSPLFYYGAYAAIGRNTEGDSSPTLKGELGWHNGGGWGFAAEGGKVWGQKYEEAFATARLDYRF